MYKTVIFLLVLHAATLMKTEHLLGTILPYICTNISQVLLIDSYLTMYTFNISEFCILKKW